MLVICATKPKSIKPKRPSSNSILHRAADVFLGKKWGGFGEPPLNKQLGKTKMIELRELFMFFLLQKRGCCYVVFLPPISDFHATPDQKE
jgi:hypothetical protein